MRFTQAYLVAPALLAAAQQTTNDGLGQATTVLDDILASSGQVTSTLDDILTGARQTASSSSDDGAIRTVTATSYTVPATTSSSTDDNDLVDNIVTKTFDGGPATLILDDGNIVGTAWDAGEVISTLRDNRDYNTLISSVPATTYTTTGNPQITDLAGLLSSGDPALRTITFGGGPATLILDNGNIVGTAFGAAELISTLRDNRDYNTLVSSVPATTITTSRGVAQATDDSDSDNAAPAATAAPMLAGGIIGAGMMVVGLL